MHKSLVLAGVGIGAGCRRRCTGGLSASASHAFSPLPERDFIRRFSRMLSCSSPASRKCVRFTLFAVVLASASLWASTAGLSGDPSQWNSDDVYRILHDSAWTKTTKLKHSDKGPSDDTGPSNPGAGNAAPMPQRMGGTGRRGMTRVASSGSGSNRPASSPTSGPAVVTIQWQSALPVRLAAAKNAGESPNTASMKAGDDYVVAVIGLPLEYFGGRAASIDSDNTTDDAQAQRVQDDLKSATSLLRSGHDPLTPVKIELDQGRDGRILFHFPKTNPITLKDKTVEFRIKMNGAEVQKKFTLKDMEYRGQLQL
jgi:hypothetical protein